MRVARATRVGDPQPLWEVQLVPTLSDTADVRFVLTPLCEDAKREAA